MSSISPDSLDIVLPQRSLSQHIITNSLVQSLVTKIRMMPNYENLKGSIELILYCCNAVENLHTQYQPKKSTDKQQKIDKKELVVNCLCQVFQLTTEEQAQIKNHIQFLYDIGKIKKLTFFKSSFRSASLWFQKRIL